METESELHRSAVALCAAADRLVARTAHWTPARWSVTVAVPAPANDELSATPAPVKSRAEAMFALVQLLAEAGSRAEGRASRPVPRLDNDLALPDQLRVMVADLVAAEPDPSVLVALAGEIDAVGRQI